MTTSTGIWWFAFGAASVAAVVVGALLVRARAPAVAAGVLAALVLVELAVPAAHSSLREHETALGFDDYATPVSEALAADGGIMLSIAGTSFTDWAYQSHALRPNANATYDARSVDGYDGGLWVTTRWADAMQLLASGPVDATLPVSWQLALPVDATSAARLGVGYAVVDLAQLRELTGDPSEPEDELLAIATPGWIGPVTRAGDIVLMQNPVRSDDGAVAFSSVVATDQDDAAARLHDLGGDTVVTEGGTELACTGDCAPRGVPVSHPEPGTARVEVDLDRPGVLSVTEQPLAGWSVTVDGADADVIPVDVLRAGVALEPGAHVVEFRYRQPGLVAGLVIVLLALLATLVLTWEPRRLRPPPPSGA